MLRLSHSYPWTNSTSYHMDLPEVISFPDPPRPPTPGPPPRPPPIPPQPPVPTPPPSPSSSMKTEWLQKLVAKQLSVLAVRLLTVWFAPGGPVSLPQPPRPPTPGPRPGPVNPMPDVPTPPPSPHRRSANNSNDDLEISDLNATLLGRMLYEYLAFQPYVFSTLREMTQSPYDFREQTKMDSQTEQLYDDKLTDCPDDPSSETRWRALAYSLAPKHVLDPHMSHSDSYRTNESYHSSETLHAGNGTFKSHSYQSLVPSLRQLLKELSDSFDIIQGLSPKTTAAVISDVPVRADHQGLRFQVHYTPKTRLCGIPLSREHIPLSNDGLAPLALTTPFNNVDLACQAPFTQELLSF